VWCDTEYAFQGGKTMSIEEIMAAIKTHQCELVEITGGEPLLQEEVPLLARELLRRNYKVLIETSGAQDISILPEEVIKIMDIKCPDSGMMEKTDWKNLDRLSPQDEIKFVVNSRGDFDWAVNVVNRYQLHRKNLVLFSPVYGVLRPEQLAEWILEERIPVRFQIQLHKVLWGETPGK
jgi:7-carboxy-7-deazaguanine synthase